MPPPPRRALSLFPSSPLRPPLQMDFPEVPEDRQGLHRGDPRVGQRHRDPRQYLGAQPQRDRVRQPLPGEDLGFEGGGGGGVEDLLSLGFQGGARERLEGAGGGTWYVLVAFSRPSMLVEGTK